MKNIRMRIIDLLDEHKDTLSECPGCSICAEIQTLSKKFNRDSTEKFKHILAKGQDMTRSDLVFLIDNDVPVAVIRKAVGINYTDFSNMLINYGLTQRRNKKEGEPKMAKITLEEYQDLKAKGKADKEIALDKGVNIQYLSQLKKKWNIRPTLSPASESKPTQEIEALQKRIELFKKEMNEKNDYILDLQNKVNELEYLHAACDDVETELASLKDELEQERKAKEEAYQKAFDIELHLGLRISDLEFQLSELLNNSESVSKVVRENEAIKELLKLYL
jgi:hypothetical protein